MNAVPSTVTTSSMSHTGSVRQNNEDALLAMPESGLWAVADGMGGHEAGGYASQCIIQHLSQTASHYRGNALVNEIPRALESANTEIYRYAQQHTNQKLAGSTIALLVMESENYHCFWSGDSRCYLLRNQRFIALTRDHTEAAQLIARGLLTPAQAENSKEANTLTDAIGVDQTPRIDYVHGHIYEEDRFLLCTDGLNKVFSDTTLAQLILQDDIDQLNQHFLHHALEAGAPDNLTSIIVNIDSAE